MSSPLDVIHPLLRMNFRDDGASTQKPFFFLAKYPTFVKFRKICVTKFNDRNYQNLKNLGNFVHKLKDVFGNKLPNLDFIYFFFFGFNCHHISIQGSRR
jgi:hypothetical protein